MKKIRYLTRDTWKPGTVDTWTDQPIQDINGDFAFYPKHNIEKYAGSICLLVFKQTIGLNIKKGMCYKLKTERKNGTVSLTVKKIKPLIDSTTPDF